MLEKKRLVRFYFQIFSLFLNHLRLRKALSSRNRCKVEIKPRQCSNVAFSVPLASGFAGSGLRKKSSFSAISPRFSALFAQSMKRRGRQGICNLFSPVLSRSSLIFSTFPMRTRRFLEHAPMGPSGFPDVRSRAPLWSRHFIRAQLGLFFASVAPFFFPHFQSELSMSIVILLPRNPGTHPAFDLGPEACGVSDEVLSQWERLEISIEFVPSERGLMAPFSPARSLA